MTSSSDDYHAQRREKRSSEQLIGIKQCIGCGATFSSSISVPDFMCNKCKKELQERERIIFKQKIRQMSNKYGIDEREIFRQILIQRNLGTKKSVQLNGLSLSHKLHHSLRKEIFNVARKMNTGRSILGRAQTVDELIAEIYGIGPEKEKFYTRSWQKTLRSLRSEMRNHLNDFKYKKRKNLKKCFLRKLYGHSKYKNKEFEIEVAA